MSPNTEFQLLWLSYRMTKTVLLECVVSALCAAIASHACFLGFHQAGLVHLHIVIVSDDDAAEIRAVDVDALRLC